LRKAGDLVEIHEGESRIGYAKDQGMGRPVFDRKATVGAICPAGPGECRQDSSSSKTNQHRQVYPGPPAVL
jgi:hypothetical protein